MFYSKNLPAWERVARVVAGIVMALYGFWGPALAGTTVASSSRRPAGSRC